MKDNLFRILKDSWEVGVRNLTLKQLNLNLKPFRKLGSESWIVADIYHHLSTHLQSTNLFGSDFFISTEIQPIKGLTDKVDLGITRISPFTEEYILLLEVKHSTPWQLFNYKRVKKSTYNDLYKNLESLTLSEILLPSKEIKGHNILSDLVKLKKIVRNLSKGSIKFIGLAMLLEESKNYNYLDDLVKKQLFSEEMIYPKIIKELPDLAISNHDVVYLELVGWKNSFKVWSCKSLDL